MTHLPLILAVAVITFSSRYFFFAHRAIKLGRFLDVFAVALFVAIGTQDLIGRGGEASGPNLAAFGGAVVGGLLFRRSMLGVVITGLSFYWAARLLLS
ncbi:MAG TPA: AzlD domain-containing protein [Acidimicrobiia bacterium]|nr:AzlD domain-containing protein [Acidimicrobiia bacterium]